MCESQHVAVKMYINYSFFYIYICSFITTEVCNLYNMHRGTLKCVPVVTLTFLGHMTSSVT